MSTNEKKVAIVTGASRGIGRAAAERLARDGFAVIINYASSDAAAREAVNAITATGGDVKAFKADVANETQVEALFDFTEQEFGGVDVTVNCAGIMITKPVVDFTVEEFDRMHAINVRGTFLVSREAARRMRAGGAIINISTAAERQAMPAYGPYAMSKGAVEGLNLILARELKGRDITVNTVGPGPVATELFLNGKDEALVERIASFNPFNRIGQPPEIAEVISFLAGSARWINGQTIYVNGGMN
ncbi:SDR family oxidoreductase [Brenneria goodwinii]|uniref:SDR family oxidoreductase n=1 Tax=Brenneria goodwinii TaxID=1109412 RepID=UPI000EF25104|nr:SDR family oxidoreductase [Brenneria goodwinii]MCG8157310.1 SDR family oxidoreductase [Brenneria goodwinii]MCG8163367.1 SDR family oxidoreductase [Brenneria goodwinii]MCG8165124.1 SDR family oxidoreductase [Brenneria goodwinii]MCG8170908.1 SDR family oxidoreductase [Brenneria goodwinii]MCG8175891.1 SDR family oxidoreductase [Brenneria goodwinii]